jgi:hypothetical protein
MNNNIPYWVPIVAALAGGALVGILNFVKDWQDRKSMERRHLRELLLNTALTHSGQLTSVFIEFIKKGQKASLAPIEATIVHLIKFSEVLLDTKITKDNIVNKLKEAREISAEVEKYIKTEEASEKNKKEEVMETIDKTT